MLQPHEDGDKVICYLSRSLNKAERLYTTSEREMLALVWAIQKLRPYIEGISFTCVTDHYSLKWLLNLKDPTGRLGRWSIKLQMYDFKVVHSKGRDLALPDMLSRTVPVINAVEPCLDTKDKWYKRMLMGVEKNPLKFLNWRLQGGKLFKCTKQDYSDLARNEDCWKEVVAKEHRHDVIKSAHDPPTSGHMGVYKTYSRLAKRYYCTRDAAGCSVVY